MKNFDVCALGEVLIDFTPAGVSAKGMPLFECNPGGAPANVLAAVNKLGGRSAFIGKIGDDAHGRFLADSMKQSDIDLTGLRIDREIPTTLAFVSLDEKGDRSFSFYRKPGADLMLRESEVDECLLSDCRIFHFGSVSLTGDPARTATLESAKKARRAGALVSYDPNYRPLLWNEEDAAVAEMKKGFDLADIIKVSDYELVLLTGETDLDRGAEILLGYGASLALISMGPGGSYIANKNASVKLATYDVKTVDTTGAGDAFLGAILSRLADKTADEIAELGKDELTDILDYANACGSLTTTKTGAAPAIPTPEEIEECRKSVPLMKEA
ncbi:MAG: carbohydrate kinase [Clostridia bacterium]|nr:carbohydrate kinase [Clostridia bacterium]